MYSSDQIQRLEKLTGDLLSRVKSNGLDKDRLEELRDVLRFHEYRYAILNDPLIADFEYDLLYKELEKLEREFPELVTPVSPTQRVATQLTKDFPTVEHLVPMLSLENSYNEDDLLDWDRKARELTGLEVLDYCIEPKFDGASISLTYENDRLLRGVTRGDGIAGDEITTNIRQIRSVPLAAALQVQPRPDPGSYRAFRQLRCRPSASRKCPARRSAGRAIYFRPQWTGQRR